MKPRQLDERVLVSGQISAADIAGLAAQGVAVLVCHRPDEEDPDQPSGHDLAAVAQAHGMSFVSIPVRGMPGPEAGSATRRAIEDAPAGRSVLMFCRSGLRSTAAWALGQREVGDDAATLRAKAARAGYDLTALPL